MLLSRSAQAELGAVLDVEGNTADFKRLELANVMLCRTSVGDMGLDLLSFPEEGHPWTKKNEETEHLTFEGQDVEIAAVTEEEVIHEKSPSIVTALPGMDGMELGSQPDSGTVMEGNRVNSKSIVTALPGMDQKEPGEQPSNEEILVSTVPEIDIRRKIPKDHCCGCTRSIENNPHTQCA
eukprot:2088309-Amphidinium_carterae.1